MTHKICLSAAALLALLLALPAPALAYDGATPDQPNRLSAGLSHTAYVDEHGTLWTWGSNQEGQLGAETQETGVDREGNQVAVSGTSLAVLEAVRSVAAGGDFTVALKTDGPLWAAGRRDAVQRCRAAAGVGESDGGEGGGQPRRRHPGRRDPVDVGG